MTARAEVLASLAAAIMAVERAVVLGNLTSEVPLEEYAELKALRRSVCDLYRRMANQGDLYRSNTGAADLIPNKITRRGWLGLDGETTGKQSEGSRS